MTKERLYQQFTTKNLLPSINNLLTITAEKQVTDNIPLVFNYQAIRREDSNKFHDRSIVIKGKIQLSSYPA